MLSLSIFCIHISIVHKMQQFYPEVSSSLRNLRQCMPLCFLLIFCFLSINLISNLI